MRFGYYGSGMGMMGVGRFIMMGVFCLIALLLLVFCTVVCIRMLRQHKRPKAEPTQQNTQNSTQNAADSALNILNERYARGEITSEEYQKIKADLKS